MPLTKTDRKKGTSKAAENRRNWPYAPKNLTESNALWYKLLKGRRFSYINFEKED
jgi:hypothetical protein